MSMGPWAAGDRVRVRPEHRGRYNRGTAAHRGDPMTVTGPNEGAVGIGPLFLGYAHYWELESAAPPKGGE